MFKHLAQEQEHYGQITGDPRHNRPDNDDIIAENRLANGLLTY